MNRKLVSTGLIAGLVAGTGAGLILQQTGLAGASSVMSAVVVDDTGTDAATTDTTNTSTDATDTDRPDRAERLTEVLQPLVDDGTLTAAQMEAVIDALETAGPMAGPMAGGMAGGRAGEMAGEMEGHGPGGHGRGGFGLDTAATALGMTSDELRTALQDGSTIADVATAQGIDVQTVIDALVAEATTRLAERVTAGDLTQAEADAKLAELTTRVTEQVNSGMPMGGPGRGHHDDDADGDDDVATTDATVATVDTAG
jgi:hypothetical protein